jgi:hypothetical protein
MIESASKGMMRSNSLKIGVNRLSTMTWTLPKLRRRSILPLSHQAGRPIRLNVSRSSTSKPARAARLVSVSRV